MTKIPDIIHVFHGAPAFMRGLLYEASLGGLNSYRHAGIRMGRTMDELVPDDANWNEWLEEVDRFRSVAKKDPRAGLDWLDVHYPRVMALVPRKRRELFISGVVQSFDM